MKLPKIGDKVTTPRARELCRHFGLHELVERIDAAPERHQSWAYANSTAQPFFERRLCRRK